MSEAPADSTPKPISWGRLLAMLILALLVFWGVTQYSAQIEANAKQDLQDNTLRMMFDTVGTSHKLADEYQDADGDLMADPPGDAGALADPEELTFTYIASATQSAEDAAEPWKELIEALSEKLGRPTRYVHYTDTEEQLRALKDGDLHICAFATGATQVAVNESGFVPVCTFGHEDGGFGYTMKLIVPADSDIQDIKGIAGKRMAFTRPRSNSGYKAPLILLKDEGLLPELDYRWGFTYGHDQSILRVAKKEFDAGAVASDLLEGMIGRGEVDGNALRVIYESERFPPAALGYAYNLTPEIRDGVRETVLGFDWAGTVLETEWGPSGATKFVPISYKDDWSNVRRIDAAVAETRAKLEAE